jgi:hypothetical protein
MRWEGMVAIAIRTCGMGGGGHRSDHWGTMPVVRWTLSVALVGWVEVVAAEEKIEHEFDSDP